MSTLDQAFAKAYGRPAESRKRPETRPPVSAPAAPHVPAGTEDTGRGACPRFRPMLEVDNFKWPSGVARLVDAAEEPLEQLLTNLVTRSIRGQKVIAWQGCRRGDGCTTLMLTAARRLAERGVKVVVVDAEMHQPRLARHLGLMPTAGWEEVLAGRLPLADVVVESLEDQVALLPWCAPAMSEPGPETPGDPAASIETLRNHYDLVLVDLGRGRKSEHDAAISSSRRPWIDAVILVHHVGKTPQTELNHAEARLRRSGIADVAVVENFV
jgi:Mrp family chromosome partitioning ATPase